MMKKFLLTLVAFIAMVAVNAQQVSRQQALQKAQQFMPDKRFSEVRNFARGGNVSDSEPYYIFNAEGKKGFVIVSGDDRTRPILGYAEQGNLEEDQMPDNMKWWLDNLASQIKAIGTSLKPAALMATNLAEIKPLIQTEWNQGAPYNYMCPDENMLDKGDKGYNAEKLCLTGCVATAMAQIMYYWKWPNECPALDSYPRGYYDDSWNFIETGRVKGLPATTFKWDKMKTTYTWGETGEAADAVAELMRYCGQAVNMDYGLDGSGASLSPNVMASVFNYSKNVRGLGRDNYSTAQWEALVYEELKAKRPVPYSGGSGSGGHQFIVDGYRGDGLFHMNWGWGYLGSYSVLSVADPWVEQAIGGKDNENAYQYGQYALIGMKPAEAGEVLMPVVYARLNEFLAKTYSRSSVNADFTDVTLNAYVESVYTVDPEMERYVQLGWGLYQDDQFVKCLGSQTKKLFIQQYNYVENNQTVSFGAGLKAGKYQLCQICRFSDNEQWQRCENYGTNSLVAEVGTTTMTIRKPDLENMSFTVNSLTTSENPEVGNPMNFIVNITNTGESSKVVLNLWIQKAGENAWTNVVQGEFYVDPGKSMDIYLGYNPIEAGIYNLKVTDTSDEALFTSTVTIAATEIVVIDNVKYLCTPAYKRATVIRNEDADRSISSITIQKTVTASGVSCRVKAIGDNAFRNFWNISNLDIPKGVETVGAWAFSNMSNLQKVVLSSTIQSIGENAFYDNSNLEVVVSNIANPCVLSDFVFKVELWNSQTNVWEVSLSPAKLYIPVNTRSKYDEAGWTAQFTKVEEGELKEGFDGVLKYSYSTGSDEATVIQDDSYQELAEVTIPATATLGGKSYKVTTVGTRAFGECYDLTSVTLSDGLESIGKYSFQRIGIKEIAFPKTLKSIGEGAFENCWQITAVLLPDNLESVGRYAFRYMSNLQKVVLPSTIQSIGDYAFFNNQNLTSVESHITEPFDISESVFAGSSTWDNTNYVDIYYPSSAKLYVPTGTKSKYAAAKGWNMFAAIEEGEVKEGFDGVLKYSYSTGSNAATVIQDDSYKNLTEVTIPARATLGGKSYKVTTIGNNAFMECYNLTSVTLPTGLVSIGKYSFQNSGIKEIAFPKTLKSIGEYAFRYCWQITALLLPDNLESIGPYAFYYMSNLKTVVLPSTIQSIGDYAFFRNSNLISVESHITKPFDISESVFAVSSTWDDTYGSIYTPSSAKLYVPIGTKSKYAAAKGWNMFAAIEEGELKEGFDGVLKYSYSTGNDEATVIQDDSYKNLTEVTIPARATLGGKSYKVTTVGTRAFRECYDLTSVTLSDGLVSIDNYAFQNTSIKEIAFPKTLKSIGEDAFEDCSQITAVLLPDNLESVGRYAFSYMSSLQKVVLPSTIQSIGDRAFFCNQNLTSVESHITEPFDISESVFAGSSTWDETNYVDIYYPSSAKLYVPTGTKSKYAAAKGWNMFAAIEEGELKEGFDGILKYSYSTGGDEATVIQDDSYKQLTEVTIPATATLGGKSYKVTAVGNNAFSECNSLASLTLPDGLVSIGNYSFYNTGIKEVAFPKALQSIGDGAFEDCRQINTLTLPDNLESIGAYAFSYMSSLQKVVLPPTIQSIGDRAFFNNQNLISVESHITEPFDISESVFAGSSTWDNTNNVYIYSLSSAILYVPVGTKPKYAAANGWNMFAAVEEGELMEGLDGILKYSYSTGGDEATVIQDDSYKQLTEVAIPATATLGGKSYKVTAVGNRAFWACNNLTSVTLSDGLVSIGNYSFYNTGIKEIAFPKTLKTIGDGAFEYCWQITAVTLPENLETVGRYAFSYMSSLQKVVLPSTIQTIGDRAFFSNQNLISVESHITEPFDIMESVFAGSSTWDDTNYVSIYYPCSAKLYVPVGTKSKYAVAKGWNMFAAIEEGEQKEGFDGILKYSYSTGNDEATVIQDDSYKQLTEVTIPATATLGGKSYKVTAVGNNAFMKCYDLTSVTLSDGLVSIGNYSFQNTGVKEIAFPKTLKTIGDGAFEDCWQITAVTLPENLETVGRYAFSYMSSLQKVVLPSTIQSIGDCAFIYNSNLISVESHIAEPFDISESVFAGSSTWDNTNYVDIYYPSSAKLYVPVGTKPKYAAVNGWNMFAAIEEGELKEGFNGILKYSYSTGGDEATVIQDDSYKQLTEVTIPATATLGGKSYSVTAVGNRAFWACNNLTSVTLSDGLVSIGNYSFYNTGIKEIAFSKALQSIGEGAFEDCWQITAVTLPENLETVGRYAFSYMSSLQKVVLPPTIQSIGDRAFFNNQNLISVESHIIEPFDISESVFAGSSTWDDTNYVSIYYPCSAKLYVPVGTKSKYTAAKGWNMFAGIEEMEPSPLPGDVDGSGDVNAADIDAVVQYIMTGKYHSKADLNHDNKVNAADIVEIVNIIKANK